MSATVSRRPPLSGSVSQSKDLRWISMRFGTSRTLSRRAKVRRTRRASAVGTVRRLLPARAEKAGGSRQGGPRARGLANLAQQADAPSGAVDSHGPRPGRIRVCGAGAGGGTAATIGRRPDGSGIAATSANAPPGIGREGVGGDGAAGEGPRRARRDEHRGGGGDDGDGGARVAAQRRELLLPAPGEQLAHDAAAGALSEHAQQQLAGGYAGA